MAEASRVVLDVRGAQPFFRSQRGGIHRYCTRLIDELLRLPSPPQLDLLARLDRPLAEATAPLMNAGRVHTASSLAPVVAEARAAGQPLVYHVASPFELDLNRSELLPSAMADAAFVATLYDTIPIIDAQDLDPALRSLWRTRAEVLNHAQLVICISEVTAQDGISRLGLDERRVRVIPLGAPDPGPALPRPSGLEEPYVLYTGGTADPRKNLARLVRAFGLLGRACDRHQLVVASDVSEHRREELRAIAAESGIEDRVRLLGWVEDDELSALYQHAEVFAYPSRYEGFALAIGEAMAHGVPVVASGTTACAEVHGHPDASFDPDDVEDIARVLARVLADAELREDLRCWSRARAATLSWAECARRTAEVYEEAVRLQGRSGERSAPPVALAAWDEPGPTTAAGRALALALASDGAAHVALALPQPGRHIEPALGQVVQLTRGSDPVACLVQDPGSLLAALTVLRRRPGIAVLWHLDWVLGDPGALAEVVTAARMVVVRDALDAWRLKATLGPGVEARELAPPVAPWREHGPGSAPSCDLLVATAPARDEVRRARTLPLITALLPNEPVSADNALRRVVHVTAALAESGTVARVLALGALDPSAVRSALPPPALARRLRLRVMPRPGTAELLSQLTAGDVVLVPLGTPRSAAEDFVDLAQGVGRPVIAPGPGGADGPGTVRLAPAAELSVVLAAVHEALAHRDAPSLPPPPARSAAQVAAALSALAREAAADRPRIL